MRITKLPVALALSLSLSLGCASSARTADIRTEDEVVIYRVSFPAPQTQMVEISITFETEGVGEALLMLPTWRPGRYEILDPAGTVRAVRAASSAGEELVIRKIDKSSWMVDTAGASEMTVSYSVFANSIGDRTRHVSATHAFLSGSAVFLYTPRLRSAPIRVEIDAPEDWGIAGGLESAPGEDGVLVADDYDMLVDCPIELGLHDRIEFDVDGVPHEIVIWPRGVEHDAEQMIEDFSKIIREHTLVFGRTPYSRYVFLIHAGVGGGGTEHLNSTILQTRRASLEGSLDNNSSYKGFLGLVSHEFFHTWNVKQLRPTGIHPYDYQRENYSDLFWVAEGTTSYYTSLTLARAGLLDAKKYFGRIASGYERLRNLPGARVQSLAESSFDAWIKFSASNTDSVNSQVSFYSKGSLVSMLLDMHVRMATENAVTLDEVLKAMFERYPLSGPGFSTADMLAVLEELTDASFEEFFAKYVSGTEEIPLVEALLVVGLELRFEATKDDEGDEDKDDDEGDEGEVDEDVETSEAPAEPKEKAFLGLTLDGSSRVRTVLSTGPAYAAGLMQGDEIIALDGRRLRSDLGARLKRHAPGDTLRFHLMRMDELTVIDVVLDGVLDGKWKCERVEDATDAQKAGYATWIGLDWPGDKPKGDDDDETDGENTGGD